MTEALGMYSRKAWMEASEWFDADDATVLERVARRAGEPDAVVVLDLDSTLYEVKTRSHAILREWATHHGEETLAAPLAPLLTSIDRGLVGYSLKDTLRSLGLDPSAPNIKPALEHLKHFWRTRFFTSEYLIHDVVYPGAVEFARRVHEAGAALVYLTGRDEPGMGRGTRERLLADGFPMTDGRTHLFLKPEATMEDLAHKTEAAPRVSALGRVVASFENEPRNLAALHQALPEAMHVFVETDCSPQPAPAVRGVYRLRSFL